MGNSPPLVHAIRRFTYTNAGVMTKIIQQLLDCIATNPFMPDKYGKMPRSIAAINNLPLIQLLHQAEDKFLSGGVRLDSLNLSMWQDFLIKVIQINYVIVAEKLLGSKYLYECDLDRIFLTIIKYYRLEIFYMFVQRL